MVIKTPYTSCRIRKGTRLENKTQSPFYFAHKASLSLKRDMITTLIFLHIQDLISPRRTDSAHHTI